MISRAKQFINSLSIVTDGFSLVELVIVVVIVGLSSAIAFPIVASNDTQAKLSEADAGLKSLHTQLRIYQGKNGSFPIALEPESIVGVVWNDFGAEHLNGKYFSEKSYTYKSETGTDFTLACASGMVLDSDRLLNQSGQLSGGF